MTPNDKAKKKYRNLRDGQTVKKGDEFFSSVTNKWQEVRLLIGEKYMEGLQAQIRRPIK